MGDKERYIYRGFGSTERVLWGCLELQRGQENYRKNKKISIINKKSGDVVKK